MSDITKKQQAVIDAAIDIIQQMNTRRSADLVKLRAAVEALLDVPATDTTIDRESP